MPVVTLSHTVDEYFQYDFASPARNEYLNVLQIERMLSSSQR